MATKTKDETELGIGISDEEVRDAKVAFGRLEPEEARIAAMIANGTRYVDVCVELDISVSVFYIKRDLILRTMQCRIAQLPKMVFAALGVLKTFSM